MDPAFLLMRFPLDGELDFYLKKNFQLKKKKTFIALFRKILKFNPIQFYEENDFDNFNLQK